MDIVERLHFDEARCEAMFSKGVASNIKEARQEIERLRAALEEVAIAAENNELLAPDMVAKFCRTALETEPQT